jgi:sialate O-acetylesterase
MPSARGVDEAMVAEPENKCRFYSYIHFQLTAMKKTLLLIATVHLSLTLLADFRLASIFADDMILQRNQPIAVWGWADAGELISIGFNGKKATASVQKNGYWKAQLPAQNAGGPFVLTASTKSGTITIKNILVGEVWLCSGQSNMEWAVRDVFNAAAEINAANYPMIRQVLIPKTIAEQPLKDITGKLSWTKAIPAEVAGFTGVGYFFAVELYKKLGVPIGLINSSWGGTDVETWTSRTAFEGSAEFQTMIARVPKLNLDSLNKVAAEKLNNRLQQLQHGLPDAGEIAKFSEPDFQDDGWPLLKVPALWESQQLPGFDGVLWMRKTIEIPESWVGRQTMLQLGYIDDNEETYLNGVAVGKTDGHNKLRQYVINNIKPGKNTIAVKITDTGGGGGCYGDANEIYLQSGTDTIFLAGNWRFQVVTVGIAMAGTGPNDYPTLLYNGMIEPLMPYTIKGVIWYQGENNASRASQYSIAFPLMIKDWRSHWGLGDFPFYFVQLASFNAANGNSEKGSSWAELREAQSATLRLPNTGMAVTTDIGTSNDIHPRNKQDVGKRLAAQALRHTYQQNIIAEGPVYDHMVVQGQNIAIYFKKSAAGLQLKTGDAKLKGFEIAGADKIFMPAEAILQGDHLVVRQAKITKPVAVRYGWMDDAGSINLFNKALFPASPFRTDQWPGITVNNSYRAE